MNTVKILDVNVNSTPKKGVLRIVSSRLVNFKDKSVSEQGLFIVTPNPEQIVLAQKDKEFGNVLNKADIAIPDAIGIVAASKFLNLPASKNPIFRFLVLNFQGKMVGLSVLFNRKWLESDMEVIKGRVLFMDLIKLANRKKWRAVLVGDEEQSAQKAVEKLRMNYKSVQLHALVGPNLYNDGKPVSSDDKKIEKDVIEKINKIKPHLLFVGFGAPKQEKWTYRWLSKLDVGCAMVVGGTFDYVSGKTKLPPKWVEEIGLEWLWRLLTGGQSIGRIITASIIFPVEAFKSKLSN